jgi:hypothetical protein
MNFNPQTAFRKQPMVYLAIALTIGILLNKFQLENTQLAMKIVNDSNSILFIDKLTDSDFEVLMNDREVIKSDVLKMSYPKQISQNFNEFLNMFMFLK